MAPTYKPLYEHRAFSVVFLVKWVNLPVSNLSPVGHFFKLRLVLANNTLRYCLSKNIFESEIIKIAKSMDFSIFVLLFVFSCQR